jgi:hypothetical protein
LPAKFDNTVIDAVIGTRYLWLKADLGLAIGGLSRQSNGSGSTLDGVVGAKGLTRLSDNWHLSYYGDIGAGDSDLTYQLFGSINYSFSALTTTLGYRHLEWDFKDGNSPLDDLDVSGPYLGAIFIF